MTLKLSKRASRRSMISSLQTSCKPILRKPKPWSSLQNLTHIRTFSFTSATKLLRELMTSRSLVFVSLSNFPGTSTLQKTLSDNSQEFSLSPVHPEHLHHTLYITLVCPILEYSCDTWHPLSKTLTNHLESVQRFACPVILQSWNLEHDDLLSHTSLPTLEACRDCAATVVYVFKISSGHSSAPNVLFLTLVPIQDITVPVRSASLFALSKKLLSSWAFFGFNLLLFLIVWASLSISVLHYYMYDWIHLIP